VDDVNIHIDELILDGASPPPPEQLHAELSRQVGEEHDQDMAVAARAIAEHLRTRLGKG
jgi:hypothetical protein